MGEPDVPWSQYDQAYKRMHDRLTEILAKISMLTESATPWSVTATSSGNTTVKTPAGGKKLQIRLVDVWNNGSVDLIVYLRFGSSGSARFKKALAAKTGYALNLVGCNWEGAIDEALIVNLSVAGTVDVTVFGEEVT